MFYNKLTREYPGQTRRPYANNRFGYEREFTMNPYVQEANWSATQHTTTPVTDILELDDQFVLEIALPGVVLDDVELKVEENYLTLIAKRTPNMFEERAHVLHKEMPCGYYVRHFEFETMIAIDHIEARLDRGILFVSLPKVESAVRIPVSHGSIESHMPGLKTRVGNKDNVSSRKEISIK